MLRPSRVGRPVGPAVGTDDRSAADPSPAANLGAPAANLLVVMMTDCVSFQQCQYEGGNQGHFSGRARQTSLRFGAGG
jgi:hypothetical protein